MKNGVVVIIGVSFGIGKSIVEYLSKKGFIVYVLVRCMDKLEDFILLGIKFLFLDVINEELIKVVIEEIYEVEGRIDVLFNNVGYGLYGLIEDVDLKDVRD